MKKTLLLKTLLLLCVLIVGSTSAWADSKTSTLSFTAACGGSGIADDGVEWAITSDGTESNFDNTKGIHYGTSSAQVKYIKLTTSDITKTITSVKVNASVASGVSATVDVAVGGNAFGGAAKSLTASAADYTFTGSATGEIVVTVTKPSKATKALYVKSVIVTYDDGPAKLPHDLAWSAATKDVTYGETPYDLPTLSNTHNIAVTYDSSNKSVATIDANGNVTINNVTGSTTISATTEGDDTYASGMVSYTLNVTRVAVVEDGVFDFDQNEDYGSGLAKSGVKEQTSTWKAGNVTMVMAGRNCWNDYTDRAEVRLYKASGDAEAGTINLSVPAGYAITKIGFTGASLAKMGAESGYAVAKDGKSSTWTGTANSVLFTATDRTDIVTITVTYGPTATIPANKEWITFCSPYNLDFTSDIAGLDGAYTITAHADKAITLTATKMTGKVKAGTGLLLRAKTVSATDAQAINIPVAATGDEQADNMLKGVLVDTEIEPKTGEYTNLGLKDGQFHPYTNGPSDMAKLAAGKAYLQIHTSQMPTGGNNARLYIVLDGEATGINAIENSELRIENLDAPMYNLAGQRVTKSYKGVVIVNGKKVVRK